MPLGLSVVANIINYQNHFESKHPNLLVGEAWLTISTVPNDKGKTMSWAQHCNNYNGTIIYMEGICLDI